MLAPSASMTIWAVGVVGPEHASNLREHLVLEAAHLGERLVGLVAFEVDVDHRHAEIAQRLEVVDDRRLRAREQATIAIARLRLDGVAVGLDPVGERDLRRIAVGLGNQLAHARDAAAIACQGIERVLLVAADRIPGVGETRGAPHARRALAADPDRRGGGLFPPLAGQEIFSIFVSGWPSSRALWRPKLFSPHDTTLARPPAVRTERR